jgi:type III restriction enzyme
VIEFFGGVVMAMKHANMPRLRRWSLSWWPHAINIARLRRLVLLKLNSIALSEPELDFRQTPKDKSNIARYLFGGFQRCLFHVQKFQSDLERKLAIIIDREALKWFKPAKGQFQIFYKSGVDPLEYQPDFVAETEDRIFMLESKARNEMEASDVLAKKEAAVKWCSHATAYAQENDGKPWQYVLIPHDAITENMSLEKLAQQFVVSKSL